MDFFALYCTVPNRTLQGLPKHLNGHPKVSEQNLLPQNMVWRTREASRPPHELDPTKPHTTGGREGGGFPTTRPHTTQGRRESLPTYRTPHHRGGRRKGDSHPQHPTPQGEKEGGGFPPRDPTPQGRRASQSTPPQPTPQKGGL